MIRTSETTAALMPALVAAQLAIGGGVAKNKRVEAGSRRYTYADLAAVIDAAGEALGAAGLAWVSSVGEQGVVVRLCHTSGEWIEVQTGVFVSSDDPQRAGSALTYGRRYGLLSLLGLAQEDDDGQAARAPKPAPRPTPEASEPSHQAAVRDAIRAAMASGLTRDDVAEVLGSCGYERVAQIDERGARGVLESLAAAAERAA